MWGASNNDFFFSGSSANPQKADNSQKIKQINDCIAKLEKAKQDIQTNVNECTGKINTDFDELAASMNERKSCIFGKLHNISQSKTNSIDTEIEKLRHYLQADDANSNAQNKWPSQRELDLIVHSHQKHQNEIFYTNQYDKQRFVALMNEYGGISLPLEKPSILFARNNAKDYLINFKWNIKLNENKHKEYKVTQVGVEWRNVEQKQDANDSSKQVNMSRLEVVPNESNIYQHCVNVSQDGTYSIRIQYFESNLQVWSKLSDVKVVSISKISEHSVKFDMFDKDFIDVSDENIVSGNGAKKGKYARMVSSSKGFNDGLHEWKVKCVEYDSWSQAGDASHAIGIFTDNEIASNGANWVNDSRIQYAYYWNSYRRYIYGSCNGEYLFENNANDGWKTGDVVSVLLDCKAWTIQFFKNGNVVNEKPYKIKSNKTYYPLIVMRSHNDKYQSLSYT